jgi:uncharacterized membrane protein
MLAEGIFNVIFSNYIFLTVMLVGFLIAFVVGLWALTIVWRCYIYLVDKKVRDRLDKNFTTTSIRFPC